MTALIHGKEYRANVSSCLWEGALCGTENGCEGDYGPRGVSCKLFHKLNFFIVLFGFLGVAPSSKGAAELWKPWN